MTPSRRLRVVYFSNSRERGGAEEHVLTLARGLDRTRFEACWVCPPQLAARVYADAPADLELIPLDLSRPAQVGAALRLAGILRERRPDILHSHLFYASLFASPIGRFCGLPVIVETPHVREHWRQGWKAGYWMDRVVGRAVDCYIAVSEANARYLVTEKGLPAWKVVVIRNGCDLERFDPARPAAPELRQRLGIPADAPVLLVLARLEPQKGHATLIAALPAILGKCPNVQVVFAGTGRLEAELRAMCEAAGLARAVHFVGFQSDVGAWLALCTATVLPSFYEGLPLAALESLAAGRPVLASAVDGTPEIVRDGEHGLTFAPGDPAALAQAVCHALADPAACRNWGRQGRRWVEQRYSQRSQLAETEALYLRAWNHRLAHPAGAPQDAAPDRPEWVELPDELRMSRGGACSARGASPLPALHREGESL